MNPHTNYLAVGVFLLLGIAGLIVLVVWLGQAGDTAPKSQYVVRIHGDVNGLSEGSVVRYLGVDVGSVASITLRKDVTPFVEALIEIDRDLPIDDATFATLVVQGVTGIANIDLGSRPGGAKPLATHSSGVPVIPFRATGLSAMLASSGDLTTDARRLVSQLNVWTGQDNLQQVQDILENIKSITDVVAQQSDDVPGIVAALKSTITKLERVADGLESALTDDWPGLARDLKTTGANLASASERVDTWLDANDRHIDELLGSGPGSVTGLVLDLREVADELSRLGSKLREDPSRLVYRAANDPVVADP